MGRQVHFEIDDDVEQALADCRRRYKISTDADVFRFAVTVLAASPVVTLAPPPPKPRGRPRKRQ
jgi:hypothetical protein